MPLFKLNRNLFWLVLAGLLLSAPAKGQEGRDTLAVFFVGNSYVYFNNLPGIIEGISDGLDGPRVITGSHTHPGYTLRRHLEDGHLPGAFGDRVAGGPRWDAVVLQEQSSLATTIDTLTGQLGSPDEFQRAVRDLENVARVGCCSGALHDMGEEEMAESDHRHFGGLPRDRS